MTRDPDTIPPPQLAKLREGAALFSRLANSVGHLGPRGPVDGPPCLVIPGFLATDRTSMELRRAFAEAGWRTWGWADGLNTGAKSDTVRDLRQRLASLHQGEHKVLVVGDGLNDAAALSKAHASMAPGAAIEAYLSSAYGWSRITRPTSLFVAGTEMPW